MLTDCDDPVSFDVPDGWDCFLLDQLADDLRGISYGIVQPGQHVAGGVPIVRVNNLRNGRIDSTEMLCVSSHVESKYERTRLRGGEVLLSLVGTLGECAVVPEKMSGWNVARAVGVIPLKPGTDPRWVACCLRSAAVQTLMKAWATTTVQATLNLRDVRRLPILLAPEKLRSAITETLSALDDKIEQNRRTAQTLEKLARAIFRAWFVDFEPVKAKAAGATSFPSMPQPAFDALPTRFVDSAIGPVPEGWGVGQFGDIVVIHDARRIPLSKREREKRRGSFRYYGATGILDWVDDYLFDGTFVLVGEDGTVIDEGDSPIVQYVWGKFWVNNHAHVLSGIDGISVEYVKTLLEHVNIRPFITGAVQLKLNQGNMKCVPVVIPNDKVVAAFDGCAKPLFSLIRQLHDESIALAAMRDYLLPRLLSGNVRVDRAEALAAAVA